MSRPVIYPPADHAVQWFEARYPGKIMALTAPVLVFHTTEGPDWPSYNGGSVAPTVTYHPGRKQWRQHFPLDVSARALQNLAGGVETNTAGAIQVELVGTCAVGGPGLFWPGASDDDLRPVADFIRWLRGNGYPLPLKAAPTWLPYPKSYGQTTARMSGAEWAAFTGVCGHQHVPENEHGDPGDFPIDRLLQLALPAPVTPPPAKNPNTGGGTTTTKTTSTGTPGVADQGAAVWTHRIHVSDDAAWRAKYGYSQPDYAAASLGVDTSWRIRAAQQDIAALTGKVDALTDMVTKLTAALQPPATTPEGGQQ